MKNKFLKTIICIVMCALAAASLAGCAGGGSEETTAALETEADEKGYTFTYKGTEIYIGAPSTILEALGEPKDKQQMSSCAFEGYDTSYYYGSFYVITGFLNDVEFIYNYYFVDDTVETDEGLCIGDAKAKVEELYGADGYNGTNAYIYRKGDCQLTVIIENDSVSSIQYAYKK